MKLISVTPKESFQHLLQMLRKNEASRSNFELKLFVMIGQICFLPQSKESYFFLVLEFFSKSVAFFSLAAATKPYIRHGHEL
jgi:hypothetical protein